MSGRSDFIPHLAVWLTCALAMAGCDGQQARSQHSTERPIEVGVVELRAGPVALSYSYPARTAPFREVEVRARVAGILTERVYTEGAKVHAGDVLFRIDPAPFEAEVSRVQAQLQQA
jgi:membrane fusion protein (multidrug efflux system)